jgi:protein RecA
MAAATTKQPSNPMLSKLALKLEMEAITPTVETKKTKKKEEKPLSFAEKRANATKTHLEALGKKYGDGAICIAANSTYRSVPRLSSGLLDLDRALGGGFPRGRVSLVSGNWSSCKTRIALSVIADAQKRSVINNKYLWEDMPEEERVPYSCCFIDVEGALSPSWAADCGVDLEKLMLARPKSQEESAEIAITAVSSGAYDLVIIDSLAQMMVESEAEAAMDDATTGMGTPKKNNTMFRKIQIHLNRLSQDVETEDILPTVIVLNQIRVKIARGPSWGAPQSSRPGGVGQDFTASCIVALWPASVEYFDTDKQFPKMANFGFVIEKNKVSTPKIHGEFVMAVADDPKGSFKAGEYLEKTAVENYAGQLGWMHNEGGYYWRGEKFQRKMDLTAKYFDDKKVFALIKRDILDVLCPKK